MAEQEENLELEEGEEEEQNEAQAKKKFTLSPMIIKILMIVAAILVVALISGLIAFFVSKSVGRAAGVNAGVVDGMIKQPPPTYFPITPEFNVNTADMDVARFVRVSIVLTYTTNVKQLAVELPERGYMIRDRIYSLISSYTYDQLRTNEGREQLKADIKREINSMLKNGQIDDILFDSFLLS
ncbi:flagellar basal body-associated FliL family protein [Brachyspira pilosicoli]|uniref:flagellar basal body-associated FliL family protein n=1 Tax=Brachyspira pilosicoli TaxID=52584 RepID=UPI00261678E4|nr:flagellar basal body-associated FliL family protein [uncultured Brachyspira sp.]